MKLTAQTTTKTPIATAMARRLGVRPVDDAIFTASSQSLFADREFFDEVEPWFESDTRARGDANRSLGRNRDFRRDDVFRPITFAGCHVAWKRKIWQRGERNIVRATNAGFEHAPAPHRNAVLLADVVNTPRCGEPANAAEFDIDDLARAQFHRRARLLFGVHTFIEANRSLKPFLKLDVAVEIVPT